MTFLKKDSRLIFLLVMVLMLALTCITGCSKDSKKDEENTAESTTEEQGLAFPYELEDGKLTVNSVFQSSLPNPDCNGEIADDIATIQLTNTSGQFIEKTAIKVKMLDGTEVPFEVTNLPADGAVLAFSSDNSSISDVRCEDITSDTEYSDAGVDETQFEVSVENSTVRIKNLTDKELKNVDVYYHCTDGDIYIGGITYKHTIDKIAGGKSQKFVDEECILGTPDAVRIVVNN